jgi:predicted AlkP superfamily phosphohydrolase/phosphomutase
MISHFFWQYYDPAPFDSVATGDVERFHNVLPEFYVYMDQILGEYLSTLQPGTDVIIVSDHGFGPDPGHSVPFRTGEHRPYGVFVANGPHFRQGLKLENASVLDITPTLLYLYGLPVAKDMDGKILTDAIVPEFKAVHDSATIRSYESGRKNSSIIRSGADTQIKDQIRALGYTQ